MAQGLNMVVLFGNLGADPELRMTPGGAAVMRLRLATTASYLDRDKVRKERTEWHSVTVWGRRAEGLAKVLSKGSKLLVRGELRTSDWIDQTTGEKKWRTEVNALDVVLGGSAPSREPRDTSDQWSEPGRVGNDDYEPREDDIPF